MSDEDFEYLVARHTSVDLERDMLKHQVDELSAEVRHLNDREGLADAAGYWREKYEHAEEVLGVTFTTDGSKWSWTTSSLGTSVRQLRESFRFSETR